MRLRRILFKRKPGIDEAFELHFKGVLEKFEDPYRCIDLANRWGRRMQKYLKTGRSIEFIASRALQMALFDESLAEINEAEDILIRFWVHGDELERCRHGRGSKDKSHKDSDD